MVKGSKGFPIYLDSPSVLIMPRGLSGFSFSSISKNLDAKWTVRKYEQNVKFKLHARTNMSSKISTRFLVAFVVI